MDKKTIMISVVAVAVGGSLFFMGAKERPDVNSSAHVNPVSGRQSFFQKAVGQKAPDFEFESISGKTVKLSDYLGKNVVLFFNEGSMCYPACWNQVAELGNDPRFDAGDTAAFSIVVDTKSQWLDIVAKSPNLTKSKILFDTARTVSSAYDVLDLESSMHPGIFPGHTYFIIDKNGVIRFTLDDPTMALANNKLINEIEKLK